MNGRESPQPRRAPTPEPVDPEERVGEVIDGRYRLTELVGQGGMGAVYRAEHVTIRRPVAVKLLHPQLAAVPELTRRFEREAFAIGRIDHPNCVNVSDFGSLADGSLFLVMEFVQGETLGELLEERGRLAPAHALSILRHVACGLGHAHQAGIVHRDVKPDNVVVFARGGDPSFAKIVDFGIAKLLGAADHEAEQDKLTAAGIAFGTPTYLSPEQAIGDEAMPASDLYSATVMLYEMLAGRPPFTAGDKLELLAMHAGKKPPPLAEVVPHVALPAEVEDLVQRGLAKKPADRFASADEYIAAIDLALAALGAPALRPPTSGADPLTPPPTGTAPFPPATITPYPPAPATSAPVPTARRLPIARMRGVAAAAAGLGALIVIGVTTSGQGNGSPVDGESSDVSQVAADKLSKGAPAETIELLEREPASIARDARAQLQLGHAYASKSQYDQAIDAYGRALGLEPALIADGALRANLELMIDDEGPILVEAAGLLIVHAEDQAAVERLLALTADARTELRHQAVLLAETLGFGERVDRVQSFALDLRHEKTCERRREAVAKLRALGDPRAIPMLEEARVRRVGSRWRRRNANACLTQAADDAIKYLRTLQGAKSD